MATTNLAAVATAVETKIRKKLLDKNVGDWDWAQWGDKGGGAELQGADTIVLNKITRPANMTADMTEGAQLSDFTTKALKTEKISVSLVQMADVFAFTDKVELASIVNREDMIEEIAQQYKRSLSKRIGRIVAQGCVRHRLDNDLTYEFNGTATSGSTTSIVAAGMTAYADNVFDKAFVSITNPTGTNYDVTRIASDYQVTGDDGTFTLAAFNHAIDSTSKFHAAVGTGIVATDVITLAGIIRCRGTIEKLQIPRMDGQIYVMPLNAELRNDMWKDTTFIATATYDDSKRFRRYDLIRWLDTEFPLNSQVYREDVDGTENEAGVVHVPIMMGRGLYEIFHWGPSGGPTSDEIKKACSVNVYIVGDKPDSVNIVCAMWWVSWKASYAALVKRATAGIGLMCGATVLPMAV
jgi:hypothetical protein